jgi:hypothetical protein
VANKVQEIDFVTGLLDQNVFQHGAVPCGCLRSLMPRDPISDFRPLCWSFGNSVRSSASPSLLHDSGIRSAQAIHN